MAETSSRTVLTPIDASTLRVVLHAGQLLGVEPALRIGQRAGRDDGAAHDEAMAERVVDVRAAHT